MSATLLKQCQETTDYSSGKKPNPPTPLNSSHASDFLPVLSTQALSMAIPNFQEPGFRGSEFWGQASGLLVQCTGRVRCLKKRYHRRKTTLLNPTLHKSKLQGANSCPLHFHLRHIKKKKHVHTSHPQQLLLQTTELLSAGSCKLSSFCWQIFFFQFTSELSIPK